MALFWSLLYSLFLYLLLKTLCQMTLLVLLFYFLVIFCFSSYFNWFMLYLYILINRAMDGKVIGPIFFLPSFTGISISVFFNTSLFNLFSCILIILYFNILEWFLVLSSVIFTFPHSTRKTRSEFYDFFFNRRSTI